MKYLRSSLSITILLASIIVSCGGNAPASNPTSAPASNPTSAPASNPTSAPASNPTSASASNPTSAPASNPTSAPASNPTSAPASTDAPSVGALKPPEGAPFDLMKKALLSVFASKSVRAKTVLTSADGSVRTLLLEYIKPDHMRIISPDGAEQIAIKGQGIWRKVDGTWHSEDPQLADMLFKIIATSTVEETLKTIQIESVKFVGADLLDGKPMFVYTYRAQTDMGDVKINSDGKIWIGALDGRPYKGESTNDSFTTPGKLDHTTVTYEYDLALDIQAPQ